MHIFWIAVDQSLLQADLIYSAAAEMEMNLRKYIKGMSHYLGVCVMMRSLISGIKGVILVVI